MSRERYVHQYSALLPLKSCQSLWLYQYILFFLKDSLSYNATLEHLILKYKFLKEFKNRLKI